MLMFVPEDVKAILEKLNSSGYEGYIVGGCVRDSLLGKKPKDWDICTNAKPEKVMEIFEGFNVIPTGLQHGTVTVMLNKEGYEITTYRIDGDYSDGRHPDKVSFTSSLAEDLARRDFTINAMAYSEEEGIVDIFNGIDDLKKGKIRCVGKAEERFSEDALRVMRAMRFASVLGFDIEEDTSKAMSKLYKNLRKVSKERIREEFSKLLKGVNNVNILREYEYIISYIIPEVKDMVGFEQHNSYHLYDVYEHTLKVISYIDRTDLVTLLAGMFHDIGKPLTFTMDEQGLGHFWGHPDKSVMLAENILKKLRYSNDEIEETLLLIKYHDYPLTISKKCVRKLLNKMSRSTLEKLLNLKYADIMGQSEKDRQLRLLEIQGIRDILQSFDFEKECYSLATLKIKGQDLIELGYKPSQQMGIILKDVLHKVMDGILENDKSVLSDYVLKNYER